MTAKKWAAIKAENMSPERIARVRREALEQALREGEESGGALTHEEVWAELQAAHPWLKR